MIQLKRAYESPAAGDGVRILVERLWPRGLSKKKAALALWLKDLAPSAELRQWFGHDPGKWNEFRRRYQAELKGTASRGWARSRAQRVPPPLPGRAEGPGRPAAAAEIPSR
jgi:uncharacterized protein YeaO (DUF488 family)